MSTITELLEQLQLVKDNIRNTINDICDSKVISDKECFDNYAEIIKQNLQKKEDKPKYKITVEVATGQSEMGSVTGGGVFDDASSIEISATANEHYTFVRWSDGDTNATRIVRVLGEKTYTAQFAAIQYTVTFTCTYTNSNGVQTKKTETKTGAYGASLTVPSITGNTFDTTQSDTIPETITGNATYNVVYNPNKYTATLKYGWNGSSTTQTATYTSTYGSLVSLADFELTEDKVKVEGYTETIPTFTRLTDNKTYSVTYGTEVTGLYGCAPLWDESGEDFNPDLANVYNNTDSLLIASPVGVIGDKKGGTLYFALAKTPGYIPEFWYYNELTSEMDNIAMEIVSGSDFDIEEVLANLNKDAEAQDYVLYYFYDKEAAQPAVEIRLRKL